MEEAVLARGEDLSVLSITAQGNTSKEKVKMIAPFVRRKSYRANS